MSNPVKTSAALSPPPSSRGRPRKFGEPARPVTITLPESTLADLRRFDPDLASAIVKLQQSFQRAEPSDRPVEVVEMAEQTGLIVIGPSKSLRQIPFLNLVEVGPGRFLLALDPGHDFRALELAIQDILEDESAETERPMLSELILQIRQMRRASQVRMAEILLVRLDAAKAR